ncbi:tRNA modification GTPase GTPBP3, mitochondrial [Anthonomus grandis grandis]|uniref:tRNA modification GTPase GTPBP3, mitochondrial n=1 Tax=Anthonomus grandis grandis TaxID=2921223 RepID=UPI0021665142|nr:tRNA modification GTPase GTPBP3, mitochondrial [Anthonomus grandis grandis]
MLTHTGLMLNAFKHKFHLLQRLKSTSTIFALSSGLGKCGVAVVRVTGPETKQAIIKLTNLKALPQPRTALLRSIQHPVSKETIDKGLVLWFPGPHSFTGEDSCEFQVHGGLAVINGILDALGSLPTYKLAEPGEFTRRAFLNGKLDLTKVEGLADLLNAETEAQRKQAFLQSEGALSKLYEKWMHALKNSMANVEAYIDFDETETLEHGIIEEVVKNIESMLKEVTAHLCDGRRGELLRNGVKAVILGEPNVGKSSLLNLLCQRPASIVTSIPGTTRDVIDVTLNIGGYPLILSDTAGLRNDTKDVIEVEGISRAKDIYKHADLVILMIDLEKYVSWLKKYNLSFVDYIQQYTKDIGIPYLLNSNSEVLPTKRFIIVVNKTDLLCNERVKSLSLSNVVKLSCKSEEGLNDLLDTLKKELQVLCGEPSKEHPSINQMRHREQLILCQRHLEKFLNEAAKQQSADLVIMAEYLRRSLRDFGKLVGTVTSEDILDVIFREFCIGK